MRHARIIEEIHRHQWAITQVALDAIVRIVTVGEELEERIIFHGSQVTVEEREADLQAAYPTTVDDVPFNYGQRHGRVGVINIDGPIIPRNAGQSPSQPKLTTIAGLQEDFARMEADEKIDRIAFMADSPGGAVTGISEFAAQIKASNKPTATYNEGHCSSAMYWIASATDAVVGADTSQSGSIGVVGKIAVNKEKDKIQVVSSQSEYKAADPETEEGKAVFQRMVDDTADVFINAVAANRETTRENVLENYGQGASVIASRALAKGMIDGVMTRAKFMQEFSGDLQACSFLKKRKGLRAQSSGNLTADDQKVDISTGHVELKDKDTAPKQAVKNPNEGAKPMDLKQLLEENQAAKTEFNQAIATAKAEGLAEFRATLEPVGKILLSDKYDAHVKGLAAGVYMGTKSKETLDAVVTMVDRDAEKENSQAAQDATDEIGNTPADNQPERSTDGKIRTNADYLAAIGKEEEIK